MRVDELRFPGKSISLSGWSSVAGLDVFTLPAVAESGVIFERVYCSLLYNNGSCRWFGEGGGAGACTNTVSLEEGTNKAWRVKGGPKSALLDTDMYDMESASTSVSITSHPDSAFDIGVYEGLKLQGMENLIFGGLFLGASGKPDQALIRKKFLHQTEDYVLGGNGGADNVMTISLKDTAVEGEDVDEHMIVAVRLLFGQTSSDHIPDSYSVLGRAKKINQKIKRWQNFAFTDEEICWGGVQGYVNVGFKGAGVSMRR